MQTTQTINWLGPRAIGLIAIAIVAASLLGLGACARGAAPKAGGVTDGRLAACPSSPNCVSSFADTDDSVHRVDVLPVTGSAEETMDALVRAIESMPRSKIITREGAYLHAEFRSRLIRYVDDLELLVQSESGVVHVRSASRIGHSDLGANRKRVGALRARLIEMQSNTEEE